MNFLSVLYARAGITVDGVTTLNNTATGLTPATNDNSTKLATTGYVKNQNYYPYPTGTTSQYVRGDGSLATFTQTGGGGSSVSYYLNGSVSQGTIGGNTYYEMSKTAIVGTNADFSINANGYVAQFVTDAGDPALLNIPGGNWNFEMFFSASSGGGSPSFYVELYKYDGTTLTLIASGSAVPESITGGTATDLYVTALAVPTTTLTLTDRLAIRVYVTHSGRTITLHTQNGHLCQIITTFTTGLTALNGLTAQVQNFAVGAGGSDFNISSVVDTHTFNLPTASATKRGALSSIDWSAFDAKVDFGDLSATAPLNYNGSGLFTIAQSSGSTNGYLSSTDWTTFNAKIGGSGTTNYVAKFTSGSVVGNSIIYDNGTNVGIGTTTPTVALQVNGSGSANNYRGVIRIINNSAEQWSGLSLPDNASSDANSSNYYFIGRGNSLANRELSFHIPTAANYGSGDQPLFRFASTGADNLMTIQAVTGNTYIKGNVGIGTTSPIDVLHVVGGISSTSLSNTLNGSIGSIQMGYDGTNGVIRTWNSSPIIIAAYNYQAFETTGAERMRIATSGNVLIGTTSGSFPLTVVGKIGANIFGDSYLEFPSNGHAILKANNDVFVGYSQNFVVKQNGYVGIGTTTPLYRLESTTTALFGTTAYGVLNIAGDNPAYIKIKTNIPFSYGAQGYTVNIKGFQYGSAQTLDLQVCWHQYVDLFTSPTITSKGSFAPVVRLARENGLVVIVLTWGQYWPKLYVESVHNYVNDGYANGWTWVDENVTGDKVVTLSYKNDFGDGFVKTAAGLVGIGTNSPSYKLDVVGTTRIQSTSYGGLIVETNDVTTIKLVSNSGSTKNWGFATTNLAVNDFGIYQSTSANGDPINAGSPILYFTGTGAATFSSSVTTGGDIIVNNNSNPYSSTNRGAIFLNGVTNSLYGFGVGGVAKGYLYHEGTNMYFENTVSGGFFNIVQVGAGYIGFQTNGSEKMRLNSSGQLLLGTTTSGSYLLDVNGTARVSGQVVSDTRFFVAGTPNVNSGDLISVRDLSATGSNTTFGGVFFNSSPGNDYSIGKLTENSVGFLQIRNGNNGAELLRIGSTGVTTITNLAGTGSRMVVADASGVLSTQAIPTGTVTGTGTTNYISKWTSGSALANSSIVDDGAGNVYVYSRLFQSNGTNQMIFGQWDGVNNRIEGSSGLPMYMVTYGSALKFGVSGDEKAQINSLGNFLVGTTSSIWATGDRGIIQVNGVGDALIGLSIGNVAKAYLYHTGTHLYVENVVNGELYFATNGATRLTIANNGAAAFGSSVTATSFSNAGLQSGEVFNATKLNAGYFVAYLQNTSASGYGLYIQNGSNSLPAIRISNAAGTVNAINLYGSGIAEFASSVTATNFIVPGGTSAQFLKADGSLDSNVYLTSTSSTFSYTSSVTLTTSFQNTGVSSTNLGTGAYLITCNANDFGVGGGQYDCTYTGLMYFFAGTTNGSDANEIVLHHTGHADNGRYIYLRTLSTVSADGKTYLQISGNGTNSGASNYQFTFKKLL